MFCQARGYSKLRIFVEHESGAKVTRPQLDAKMSEVRTGKVARVVGPSLDNPAVGRGQRVELLELTKGCWKRQQLRALS